MLRQPIKRRPLTPVFRSQIRRGAVEPGGTPGSSLNLIWHIDFSNSNSYTETSGAITDVHDLTSTQTDLSQSTPAERPSLISAAHNGLDCARFDGSNDNVFSTTTPSFLGDDAPDKKTIIMVAASSGSTTGRYFFSQGSSASTTPVFALQRASGDHPALLSRQTLPGNLFTFNSDSAAASFDNSLHVYSFIFRNTDDEGECAVDGGTADLVSNTMTFFSGDRTTLGALRRNSGVELAWAGDICEAYMWSRELSSTELAINVSSLKTKWGIT